MLRYLAKRAVTYLLMIFLTTTAGYFLAVSTLKPALLEQERIPRPTPEQVANSFRLKGLDPTLSPWERYVDWLTAIVTRWDWGRSPNGAFINAEFGDRVLDLHPAVPGLHHPDPDHRRRARRLHRRAAVQVPGPGHHVLQLPRVHRARADRLLPGPARRHQHQRDRRRTNLVRHRHLHSGAGGRRLGPVRRHAGPLRRADLRHHHRGLGHVPDRPAPVPAGQRQRRLRPHGPGQGPDPQPGHHPPCPAGLLHPRGAEHRVHHPGHLRRRLLRREDLRLARRRAPGPSTPSPCRTSTRPPPPWPTAR